MPWAGVLLPALFFKDHLYAFSRTECESDSQYQGSFGGQVHATHFFMKIIPAQLLYFKVCTQSVPLAMEPCMYLQEWLSVPIRSLLGINLVGNRKMLEVVDVPESILSFSSSEFFWVRLARCHPDLQVTVLAWEGEEARAPFSPSPQPGETSWHVHETLISLGHRQAWVSSSV